MGKITQLVSIAMQYVDVEPNDIDKLLEDYSILHLAVLLRGDMEAINFILSEEADLACKKDSLGRTPLHCVLAILVPNDMESFELALTYFKALIDARPNAVIIEDHNKKTPLQLICELLPSEYDTGAENSQTNSISGAHLKIVKTLYSAMPSF